MPRQRAKQEVTHGDKLLCEDDRNIDQAMKTKLTITLLLLSSLSLSAADTFTISGKDISVPQPEGFVRITDEMVAVSKLVQQMADPVNDTLAYYIMESELPTAMAGGMPSLEKTFMLKVNKGLRGMTVGKNDFSQLKGMTKSQNQKVFESVKAQAPDQMKKMSEGVSKEFNVDVAMEISQMVPLDPHYESESALAYSMYLNFGVGAGETKTEEIVSATAIFLNASGTVLFLYGYAPKSELEWTREASRKWAESVMAVNGPPPATSSGGRTFDWGKVMEKGLVGAVAGGLIALFFGVVSRLQRKKG